MAGGFGGDGRLDLDELGDVIDAPGGYRLDDAGGDDLLGDDSRISLAERLEDAGVLPWVRRHRIPLGAVAVVVLGVSAAGTSYARNRPPDVATVPDVELFAASPQGVADYGGIVGSGGGTVIQGAYRVALGPGAVAAVVDGIRGPGLRASAAVPGVGASAGLQLVAATVGCDDRALAAAPGDFRVHVTTTDPWGRTVAGWLEDPVPVASLGFGWTEQVQYACWQPMANELVRWGPVAVSTSLETSTVGLDIPVRSDLPVDSVLATGPMEWDDAAMRTGALVPVAAHGTAPLHVDLRVRDCTDELQLPDVSVPVPGSVNGWRQASGVNVGISGGGQQFGAGLAIPFDDRTAARVRSAMDRVCAGAPPVRLRDLSAPSTQPTDSVATIPLVLDVDLPRGIRGDVTVESQDYGDGVVVAPAPVPTGGGRATALWRVQCGYAPSAPMASLVARDRDGRVWPYRLGLPLKEVAVALVAACPAISLQQLQDEGSWPLEGLSMVVSSG